MLTLRLPERPLWRHALSLLAGVSGVLCFAPFALFWLAPFVWAVLFAVLRSSKTTAQAALSAFLFGLGFFLTGVSWIYISLSVFGGMPWWLAAPATVLFCALLASCYALAGALWQYARPPAFWRQALLFAALIAAVDWLRSWLFTGFPWLSLGYSQVPASPLAGFAPLFGVFALSLLLALSAALLLRWRLALPAVAAMAALGWGLQQLEWTQPASAPVSVALIQGNIPQDMKFRPDAFIRTLTLYRDLVAAHPAQLTLLPETALPVFVDRLPVEYLDELRDLARRHNGDLIVGTVTGDPAGAYYNSAISLGSSPQQIYRKSHLVPFGETIPAGFAWLMAQASIPMSSFSAGALQQPPLQVAGQHVAVNICYEDVFGDEIITALPQAGILANLSNTAWFGDSLAQPQHLQIARMRALETGRPMLRATNTGMTAIIGPRGEIQASLPAFTTGVLLGEVQSYQGLTPYARWGNGPALGLMLIFLTLGATGRRR